MSERHNTHELRIWSMCFSVRCKINRMHIHSSITRTWLVTAEEIDVRYTCCPAGTAFFWCQRSSPPYCFTVLQVNIVRNIHRCILVSLVDILDNLLHSLISNIYRSLLLIPTAAPLRAWSVVPNNILPPQRSWETNVGDPYLSAQGLEFGNRRCRPADEARRVELQEEHISNNIRPAGHWFPPEGGEYSWTGSRRFGVACERGRPHLPLVSVLEMRTKKIE